ncbi:TPA: ead/Ea22-like family protein [Citrobacter braakii]|nr:ead/Ea22-like family protein [Citrobacter braakii]
MNIPTYQELEDKVLELAVQLANAESKCRELAAENAGLKKAAEFATADDMWIEQADGMLDYRYADWYVDVMKAAMETPATDAFLAEVRAQAHKEGAHFVANRMLAAWESGFIEDTAKNAADIARMILTSTEFMADAPEGDFDRSFADGVLEDIAAQLRKGAAL